MKILGIDTSSYINAIGITDGDRILADYSFEARTDSLEKIVSNIDFALKSAGLTLDDIQGFGVGLGPGSWTGIRIGVTAGKILAYSTGKPVFGIPTLEALAFSAGNVPEIICAIINVGVRDAVYAAFYRMENNGVTRIGDYHVGELQSLAKMVREPVVLIGPSAKSCGKLMNQESGSSKAIVKTVEKLPSGSAVALLAANRYQHGKSDDVLSLTPLYLKESTARAFMGKYTRHARPKGQESQSC